RFDGVARADLAGRFRAHRLQLADERIETVARRRARLAFVPGEALLSGLDGDDDVEIGRARGDHLADRPLELGAGQRLVADDQVGAHRTPPWRNAVLFKTVRLGSNPGWGASWLRAAMRPVPTAARPRPE